MFNSVKQLPRLTSLLLCVALLINILPATAIKTYAVITDEVSQAIDSGNSVITEKPINEINQEA